MRHYYFQLVLLLGLLFAFKAQDANVEQTGMMNSKIKDYQEVMNLDAATIQSDCTEVKKFYERSIEAYDFLSTFTIETMEETLQNIGKLRTLGNDLEQQAAATFEQMALRDQLEETRTQKRIQELQWRVNWSQNAKSSEIPAEEINAMKEEITQISGDKQKELDDLISQKTKEQTQITEQIQLGESSYNKLNADKEDISNALIVLNDKLENNDKEMKETLEANATRGDKLNTLFLQLNFFENQKKNAISFDSIKQLAQLQMRTQSEINQLNNDIESANNKVSQVEQSNSEVNDKLITKKAELQEISLQIDNVNSQLLQIKQQSQDLASLLQQKKQEQQMLFSQLVQKTSFLQMSQELNDKEKELQRAQEKVQEGKDRVERLEREEQMYQESYMRAQQQTNEINQKLLTIDDPNEKEQLEEQLQRYNSQYQRAWANYIEKKEELVKEKQLLVTFENFEASIQNDELQEEKKQIETKKQEQEQREQEIEMKTEQLENKLKIKEEEKGEACALNLQPEEEQNETQIEDDDGPIIMPGPKPLTPQEQVPTPQQVTPEPEVPQPEVPQPNEEPAPVPQPQPEPTPEGPQPVQEEKPNEIPQPKPIVELPNPTYPLERPHVEQPVDEIIKTKISPEAEKEIEKAEESEKKQKIVNELQELLKQYEELIIIKEQHVEEQLKIVVEKEQVIIKRETEIHEASENIKQEVQKCKEQKREIIIEARQEKDNSRSRLAEQEARRELERLNIQFKEEFQKEAEIFKKKKAAEEKEEIVREKQAKLDKKVEEIEKKIFKDIPKPKKSDKISVDIGRMSPPSTSYQRVAGSTIPLAYPWQQRKFDFKDEVIVPKPEAEVTKEEITIKEQEKKAEVQKEVIEEQKEEIKKEEQQVQLKEYEIKQKEQHYEDKKVEVQQEISKLDEEIERCKLIFGQGDEQSQEYQMCQWQSSDYEQKKSQLEQMKQDYEKELREFTKSKEEFYKNQVSSFVEEKIDIINEKLQKHLNNLIQLSNRNKRQLTKSLRHKDGMSQLLQNANKLSESLKTALLSIQDNRDEVKQTLKQVLDEINKLYETARIQRNLKQGQNKLLEQKKVLMKMQANCLEAQKILQQ